MNTKTLRASLLAVTTAIALSAALAPIAAHAYDENSTAAVNVDAKGVGLQGHDPVAYFTAGAPTAGKAEFNAAHAGVTYHFASAANRDAFKADPAKYAPQYGGFCAWAVSNDDTADIDPNAWKIVNGKLYLNYSLEIQKKWEADIPGNVAKADKNWPALRDD